MEMDYKKAYKQALERAKNVLNGEAIDGEPGTSISEYIFPELKESEDEKIRKALVNTFEFYDPPMNSPYLLGISKNDVLAWLKKQGEQKPANKVEPKFKVGDWVVYDRNDSSREILYVYDIRDGRYHFNDNIHFSWSIKECDEKCHLWTFDDAKDGDILYISTKELEINDFVKQEWLIIYENYDSVRIRDYAAYPFDGNVYINSIAGWGYLDDVEEIHPATREQQEILFNKLKEKGCEWDAEKKRLNIIT